MQKPLSHKGLFHVRRSRNTACRQDHTFIGNAAFSGAPGELRYYHSGGRTYIEMQTGTSADNEGVIRLTGIHTPDAGWFVL